jgi:hypothetical protein
MIDPYDLPHPDGPADPDDLPMPLAGPSWLDNEEPAQTGWHSDFSLVREDPE